MEVKLAKTAGFCFGVDRAVNMVYELLAKGEKVCTLGPIIHNPQLVAALSQKGVRIIECVSQAQPDETVVIRSHGVGKGVYEQLFSRKIKYADATCPFVSKIHKIVADESANGNNIIITGDKKHPETIGIVEHCKSNGNNSVFVVKNVDDVKKLSIIDKKILDVPTALISQTTFSTQTWENITKTMKSLYTNIKIFDTICSATGERQREAIELSMRSELVIVIGGRESSNTQKLKEVCEKSCKTLLIETAKELYECEEYKQLILNCSKISVTAGASTPSAIIKEVLQTMSEIENTNIDNEDFNFEEALEKSLKTVYTGEKITGLVTNVTPTEVQVEIGTKHMGFIPLSELTDQPGVLPSDLVKKGDELELIAIRVNDIEGIVTLSKRKLDEIKGREIVAAASETGDVLEGTVTEVIKGGVIVSCNGVKIFVPASQATFSRDDALEDLLKTKVKFKIIEPGERRRRPVGSIKAVTAAARKEAQEKIWATIEVGKAYTGNVKSITSYGAFVDIGGVDGMIHVSELSWSRIKHPSEVVKIGDVVEVYVKDVNLETKKISLGYKKTEDNPWLIAKNKVSVGCVCDVKVVSMTPFGAFVEIVPGVDGLIHISQISTERIEKPSDIFEIGQIVTAKITEFDVEAKRISLSIRALIEEKEQAENALKATDTSASTIIASTDNMEALKDAE